MSTIDHIPSPANQSDVHVVIGASLTILDRIGPRLTAELLHPWEVERASRLRRPADRDGLRASHVLARLMSAWAVGLTARHVGPDSLRQDCPDCGSPRHGLPRTPGIDVAVRWAHAEDLVAVACAPGAGTPLGCDVERTTAAPPNWRGEQLTLSEWCRLECEVKAGLGNLDERLAAHTQGATPETSLHWTEREIALGQTRAHLTVLAPRPAMVTTWD